MLGANLRLLLYGEVSVMNVLQKDLAYGVITILTIRTQEIGGQKWRKMWKSADFARWKKKRYVRAISDVSGSIAGR